MEVIKNMKYSSFYEGKYPIRIERNPYFFARVQWVLYKIFGIKRSVPCGRRKGEKYLCCCQPSEDKRIFFNEDHTEAYCKVCNSIRAMSNHPFNSLKEAIEF